jgi:hypothetical protein
MSSYIDTRARKTSLGGGYYGDEAHSWADFTADRLCWLYGPNFVAERAAQTHADLTAWARVGSKRSAA